MSEKHLHIFNNERPPPSVKVDIKTLSPSVEIPVELIMADEKMSRVWEPARAEAFRPILHKAVEDLLASGEIKAVLLYLRSFNQELDADITVQKRRSFWSWLAEVSAIVVAKVATEVTTFFLGPKP